MPRRGNGSVAANSNWQIAVSKIRISKTYKLKERAVKPALFELLIGSSYLPPRCPPPARGPRSPPPPPRGPPLPPPLPPRRCLPPRPPPPPGGRSPRGRSGRG